MRKDVRTGAAIGGVLIVAIVIYAIVASRGHNTKKDVAIDAGKSSPAGETGGAERPGVADAVTSAHDEHGEPSAALTHEPLTFNVVPPATPTPTHTDETATPAPSGDAEAAMSEHRKSWFTRLSAETPAITETPQPTRAAADAPTGPDGTPGSGLTNVSTHRADPTPTGETVSPVIPPAVVRDRTSAVANSTGGQTHKVVSGETFSSIARATYGDSKYFKDIIKANPKVDPSHLRPGMTIILPEKPQDRHEAAPERDSAPASGAPSETRHHAATPAAAAPIDPKTEYRVQSSDSLYRISMKLYHSPNKVDAIYQLNKDQIGTDPAKLKLNMVLKLPEPPAQTPAH